jgi:hypothetical protein
MARRTLADKLPVAPNSLPTIALRGILVEFSEDSRFSREILSMTNPVSATWLRLRRLLRSWGEKVLIVVVFGALAMGVTWLGSRAGRPSGALEPGNYPGSGITVRVEVLHLWLPEALINLVGQRSETSVVLTHQELRTYLERRGRENLWYALTTRRHQVNGGMAEITLIRHPYDDPQQFGELLDVLATAAGNPPRDPPLYYTAAAVHILPEALAQREPREVVEGLLSVPFPPSASSQGSSSQRKERSNP